MKLIFNFGHSYLVSNANSVRPRNSRLKWHLARQAGIWQQESGSRRVVEAIDRWTICGFYSLGDPALLKRFGHFY